MIRAALTTPAAPAIDLAIFSLFPLPYFDSLTHIAAIMCLVIKLTSIGTHMKEAASTPSPFYSTHRNRVR